MLAKVLFTLLFRCIGYARDFYGEAKWDASLSLKGYWGDRKLGIDTGWYAYTNSHNSNGESFRYEPTSYAVIQKAIDFIKFKEDDVLIDYGCGSGRVLFAIATQRLKKIIGIEFDDALVNIAKSNLKHSKHKITPVEIIHMDATIFDPIEGTVIYLGNPFGEKTLKIVLDNIKSSLDRNPRTIRIVYFNSTGKNVLDQIDWLEFDGTIDTNYSGTTVWKSKLLQ